MFCVVGLGNPGKEYERTRHNIGFMVVRELSRILSIHQSSNKYHSEIARSPIAEKETLLALPQTYMNESGRAVREITRGENILVENVIVVHDDVDLPVGTIRIRRGGSAGGHHGIESILAHLGSSDFLRVRIGIGREGEGGDITDYVLDQIPKGELPLLTESIRNAVQAIQVLIVDGVEVAMNRFNRKSTPE